MNGRTADCLGKKYGRWTVLVPAEKDTDGASRWLCLCECGTRRPVRARSLIRGISMSCGCLSREINRARHGTTSAGWKGGRVITSSGYALVHSPSHPAAHRRGYVAEHRLVMEAILGRYLRPEETVHHKNGVRTDNRPENLELWSSRQPKGQRVSDLLEWAQEIIALYGEPK